MPNAENMESKLDEVFAKQSLWKSPTCVAIAKAILEWFTDLSQPSFADEVDLSFVSEGDKNVIGSVWRQLAKQGFLEKTDKPPRRSKMRHLVFCYRVDNLGLCKSWLKRFGGNAGDPQQSLPL